MDQRSHEAELEILLAVYQTERQDEHHSGMFTLTLVTVGVAYMAAAAAGALQCRAEGICTGNTIISLALLFLPLAPVALLGFLALNMAISGIRGRYLVAIEQKLMKTYHVKTDDGLMIPSFSSLGRSMYDVKSDRKNRLHLLVNYLSFGAMVVIVALFIVGIALAASPKVPLSIALIAILLYLSIVALEVLIAWRGPGNDPWTSFQAPSSTIDSAQRS